MFPLLTMLSVMKEGDGGRFKIHETTRRNKEGEEVAIKEIHVTPELRLTTPTGCCELPKCS